MADWEQERHCPCAREAQAESSSRRSLLAASLVLVAAPLVPASTAAADNPRRLKPQAGDGLAYMTGEKQGKQITPADLKVGAPPVLAYPLDMASQTVRDGARTNLLALVKLRPDDLPAALKADAADGVVAGLSARGVGLHLKPGSPATPIVPAAVLYDLVNPGDKAWGLDPPYRRLGLESLDAATADFPLGSVGAGRGAMAGLIKGGIGSASIDLGDGLVVAALIVANPVGSVLMPDGRTYWAWPFEIDGEFGGARPDPSVSAIDPAPDQARLEELGRLQPGAATTIGVVATTADLSTAECKRVAMMAHDGLARAVRPAHMPFDGDTLFSLATGAVSIGAGNPRDVWLAAIGSAAADCTARAIARGVYEASKGL